MLIIPAIDLKDGQCVRLRQGLMEDSTVNGEVVTAIAAAYPGLPIQIGGGIRSLDTIEHYVRAGVDYVIIGTKAVKEPAFVAEACRAFPGKVIVGLDAKEGLVATDGWAEVSTVLATDLARQFEADGVSAIVYTDIARDGMMQGVNVEATLGMARASSIPVIASGGITNMDDIRALRAVAHEGICGAITGRAIYEGTLDVAEAQRLCDAAG
jgi:phosphoribosylformimino-5-aminoimidazole carboxamide ribotide isomerase